MIRGLLHAPAYDPGTIRARTTVFRMSSHPSSLAHANGVPGLPLHHCLNQGTSLSDAMRRPWTLVTPYTTLYFIVAVLTAPRLRNSVQALLNVFSAWPEIPSVWLWPRR